MMGVHSASPREASLTLVMLKKPMHSLGTTNSRRQEQPKRNRESQTTPENLTPEQVLGLPACRSFTANVRREETGRRISIHRLVWLLVGEIRSAVKG
uniref:Uncharacterized protein n=1 Tax=Aegilops tauschii subsp. strangulata TaxID=200361 RepID=A0A453HH46_AEGTS